MTLIDPVYPYVKVLLLPKGFQKRWGTGNYQHSRITSIWSRHFLHDHFPRLQQRHLLLPAPGTDSALVLAAWYRDRNSVPEWRRAAHACHVRRFVLAPPPESDLRGGWWKAGAR